MIRRYNYTGRKRLLSRKIRINEWIKNGKKSFEVICDLKDFGFPDEAKIFIEPYFKSSFLRFEFGTIARFQIPEDTDISDLPTTDQLWYRVKIVDESSKLGLILGTADIQGTSIESPEGSRQSILPVDFVDLGKRVWTLDFRSDRPYLAVNSSIENIREKVKSDDVFFSLIYPEVIKRIALEVAEEDGFWDKELTGWQAEWMRFFTEVLMQTHMPIENDPVCIEEWCNDVSDAFARKYKVIERYNSLSKNL